MGPCCILKTIKNVKGILPATAHVSTLETRNQPFIYSVASLPHFISSPVYFISFYTHLASLIRNGLHHVLGLPGVNVNSYERY